MLWFLSISLSLLTNLMQLGGQPQVVEKDGPYQRIALTDSTSLEVYEGSDTIYVIMTVCAPQCSSCARVYNKEWEYLFPLEPPFQSVFPLATFTDKATGRIEWTDNNTWNYQSTL